jgi:hypothetical protein
VEERVGERRCLAVLWNPSLRLSPRQRGEREKAAVYVKHIYGFILFYRR